MKNDYVKSLVDSNILIYLADTSEEHRNGLAKAWLADSFGKTIYISSQNLREFTFKCLVKSVDPKIIIEFLDLFTARFTVLQDDFFDTKTAVELCKGNKKLFWDASIVSVMQRNKIDYIFTENTKDFVALGVKAINPLK